MLIDVHKAPPAVLPLLEHEVELAACGAENDDGGVDGGGGAAGGTGVPRPMLPRIIMTAESDVPAFANFRTAIKVALHLGWLLGLQDTRAGPLS